MSQNQETIDQVDQPMSQNVPECPTENFQNHELTDKQLSAIDLLVAGRPDTDVAYALNLNRKTLYRWRYHNPLFQAELNRRRQSLWHNSADRLRSLLEPALDILEKQLKDPYEKTAINAATCVLRLAGAQKIASPIGPTEESEILKDLVLAERDQFNPENENAVSNEDLADMLEKKLESESAPPEGSET